MKIKDFIKLDDVENFYRERHTVLRTKSIANPGDDRYSLENFKEELELSPIECEIEKQEIETQEIDDD